MFNETQYEPTETDYADWISVLKLNEAEDFGTDPLPGEEEYFDKEEDELDINFWIEVEKEEGRDAIRKRTSPTSYPSYLDHEGESWVGNEEDEEPDDSMDGDATSALESVNGPTDYPEYDYDEGWCDFEDNGEGFAC